MYCDTRVGAIYTPRHAEALLSGKSLKNKKLFLLAYIVHWKQSQ
jgi:hypothetical protein